MKNIVIQVTSVSKQYRLGKVGRKTLQEDVNRWLYKLMGKEDPFLKIGEENDRAVKGLSNYVWALQNVSFSVSNGEVIGIIGRNGAGKSTLLKILSKVTTPTRGQVKIKGRIASLLEVGTGFHPELTGRDNVFLNGAILGMTKKEIASRFDEIVDFSGVERYIDTPVKRYSSGMYVRLAFAVAAHLEPDILIVDEVLAVGDAEFQKKCLGKMKEVNEKEGRTVLFVSHNMSAVKSLCAKAIILEKGCLTFCGTSELAISKYLNSDNPVVNHRIARNGEYSNEWVAIHEIGIKRTNSHYTDIISMDAASLFELSISNLRNEPALGITLHVKDEEGKIIFTTSSLSGDMLLKEGKNTVNCIFPANFFNTGVFYVNLLIVKDRKMVVFEENDFVSFSINEISKPLGAWMGKNPGSLKPSFKWEITNNLL